MGGKDVNKDVAECSHVQLQGVAAVQGSGHGSVQSLAFVSQHFYRLTVDNTGWYQASQWLDRAGEFSLVPRSHFNFCSLISEVLINLNPLCSGHFAVQSRGVWPD